MKGLRLLLVVMLIVRTIKTEKEAETEAETKVIIEVDKDNKDDSGELFTAPAEANGEMHQQQNQTDASNEDYLNDVGDGNADDDVHGRLLRPIPLFTNDERCSEIGVCSGMDYGDRDVVVTFDRKPDIHITSKTTYDIMPPKDYFTLTFVNSKFTNFPLQLFFAFHVEELDFRNCSLENLKWDNFLGADNLTILLLSENRLSEIKPMLFSYAENLSFLFLDANRIEVLYNDSFQGLQRLNFLDLHNNLIEILPSEIFSSLPSIQQINLAENRLKVIEHVLFADNPHLFSIHLQRNALNEIQDYAFQNQQFLKYLDVSHNRDLEVLVCANVKVENLWAKNCSLNRVNIYGEALHVDLQHNFIRELYFSKPEFLETLRLKDNALEQISSLELTTNLRILDVSNNPDLKTLPDLWQINALERLDLSNTSLKTLPLDMLRNTPSKLRSLNVSCNQLEQIDPLNFKYLQGLSQFYIHENNWNCYNLQMLMDMVIKPLKISYTHDQSDVNFPGEYIHGIKCMYRMPETDDEFESEAFASRQLDNLKEEPTSNTPSSNVQQFNNQLKFEDTKEVEKLRRELKAIIGIYEQKFAFVLDKLNDVDVRLKEFERFNQSLWRQVSIMV